MTEHSVTVTLSEPIYNLIKERAEKKQHTVEDELREAMAVVLQDSTRLADEVEDSRVKLTAMNDEALWRAARTTLPKTSLHRLERLNLKQQREGLTASEREERDALAQRYERVILVRSQAASLLKQRGHDVSGLLSET